VNEVFAIRHAETAWSLSGQHTGVTDIPLTENGKRRTEKMRPLLAKDTFVLILVSPLQRARQTCALMGLGGNAVVEPDLMEWNYGEYEGLTPAQIKNVTPDWRLFRDGCPGGETPEQVGRRVDRVIARARAVDGNVALFSHGHLLRVLVARWIGLPAEGGEHFLLDTGTLCVLGYYGREPALRIWNGPLISAQQAMPALVAPERSPQQPASKGVISREEHDAVLFDLDGVITDTASIHAACWKKMFDEYLQTRAKAKCETFHPFDPAGDYRLYVDGKSRLDGVRGFLESRGIHLPEGHPDDPPDAETVAGLGNRKNFLFDEIIEDRGVQPYPGSVKLIQQLRQRGFGIAVVSSSHNCTAVLSAANLEAYFNERVDGNTIDTEHLAGKPAPDTYLMAAKLLGVEPSRAVVIEDAIAGVEAGFNGHFGLVIGVARTGNDGELLHHGANLAVKDLGELVD
jgi:beta-phosphoglucomutase family hydrolase